MKIHEHLLSCKCPQCEAKIEIVMPMSWGNGPYALFRLICEENHYQYVEVEKSKFEDLNIQPQKAGIV